MSEAGEAEVLVQRAFLMKPAALEALRLKSGRTQKSFALDGGISPKRLRDWLAGGFGSYDKILTFSQFYRVDGASIAEGFPEMPVPPLPLGKALAVIRVDDLPAEYRGKIKTYADLLAEIKRLSGSLHALSTFASVHLGHGRMGSMEIEVIGSPEELAELEAAYKAGLLKPLGVTAFQVVESPLDTDGEDVDAEDDLVKSRLKGAENERDVQRYGLVFPPFSIGWIKDPPARKIDEFEYPEWYFTLFRGWIEEVAYTLESEYQNFISNQKLKGVSYKYGIKYGGWPRVDGKLSKSEASDYISDLQVALKTIITIAPIVAQFESMVKSCSVRIEKQIALLKHVIELDSSLSSPSESKANHKSEESDTIT